jgi:REP element-mobilizing transposase RayT
MSRAAQRFEPATLYHIRQHAEFNTWVYIDEDCYNVGLDLLQQYSERYHVPVHAYCLMPDHFHLLLEAPFQRAIPDMMRDMLGTYSKYINARYREKARNARRYATTGDYFEFDEPEGSIWNWQRNYRYCGIPWSAYDVAVRFVETEPVRNAECAIASDWAWSSARARCQGRCHRGLAALRHNRSEGRNWEAFHALPDDHPSAEPLEISAMIEATERRVPIEKVLKEWNLRNSRREAATA